MPKVYKRGTAELDLEEHYLYLAENAGITVADRFLSNAETSFADLAYQPGMGTPVRRCTCALQNCPGCANGQ